ncbi:MULTISPECIES: hypothetical protein [Paraburkholderia]|uniref:hypothetical protein n=1 Tax=Paraburkholderia TaxID=1822464 RepID=UPI0013A6D455|nr:MULTISPECIES: hypothetical protein [Paraburkholderia]MDH6153107.1 hypothetical protein [Paraburkholderia sp. WSM4179]
MHMFVKFRLAAALTLTASMSALAATPSLFGSCDSNGECSAIFSRSLSEAKALCGERITSIAWRKDSKPILLQCVGSATDGEDNVSYIVNESDVVGLNYGRYVKINFLQQNPAAPVPDKFGEVPVCVPANLEKLQKSTFVLLYKRPDETGDSYCYDITYLSSSVGGVRLDTNTGTVSATDRTYFSGHASDRTRQRVKKLIQVFQTWHDEQPN